MTWRRFIPIRLKTTPVPTRVRFQELSFHFSAPYRVARRARTRGIENRICRLARDVCAPGSVAIDVGASYGFVTLVTALSMRQGHLHAFEIEPRTARALRRNVARNHVGHLVTVHEQGVGTEPSLALDSLRLNRLDFLKVDTDGTDHRVLLGARETLQALHPVVVVEMCAHQQEIYDFLTAIGYTHFMGMSNEPVVPGTWPPNLIASREPVRIPMPS